MCKNSKNFLDKQDFCSFHIIIYTFAVSILNHYKVKKEATTDIMIPIKGLSSGVFTYLYTLEQSFFDRFENHDIREAHIEVNVSLEKQIDRIRMDVALKGSLLRFCDRCLGDVSIPVSYDAPIVVEFSKTVIEEESDELLIITPTATEIDLTQYIYDSVCVTLPLQTLHPSGYCDPEMEQKIASLIIN